MSQQIIDHDANVDDTKKPAVSPTQVNVTMSAPQMPPTIPVGNWQQEAGARLESELSRSQAKSTNTEDMLNKAKDAAKNLGGKSLALGKKLSALGMKELPILLVVTLVLLLLTWFRFWWCALLAIICCGAYIAVKKIPVMPGIVKLIIRAAAWLFTGLQVLLAIIL